MDDKKTENGTTIALTVLCCIVLLVLIIIITRAAIQQNHLNTCETWPASWCYTDWLCLDPNNENNAINMSELTLFGISGTNWRCNTLNEETVKKFVYSDGVTTYTKYPEYEVNIWSEGCDNVTAKNCPMYSVGDIFWPSCSGSPSSKYWTDPKYYEKTAADALVLKRASGTPM
uniref:Uncharacterized protein n=1 Tax=viral metagenome TaxID=1070528 RepID=A0A6C0ADM7_9ZZZZ